MPHQGQRWNCSTVSREPPPFSARLCWSRASSNRFGDTSVPTHSPIRNGSSPHVVRVAAPRHLRRAHQRGRPLELLRGQEPQRVPHQHGYSGIAVKAAVRGVEFTLQPPDRERVRREAQVRLGLAAAGREEQQLCLGQVPGALLRGGVGQQRQLHEDERELERAPRVRLEAREDRVAGLVDGLVRVLRAAARDLALHTLIGHHLIHEPEAPQRVRVLKEVLEPGRELVLHLARLADRVQALVAQVIGKLVRPSLLAVEPRLVLVHDRGQASPELVLGGRGQVPHVQEGVDLLGLDLRGLADRQPGGPHFAGPALALGDVPADRAGAADREFEAVPVLQVQPPQLVVRLPPVVEQRIGDRQERGIPVRGDGELRLVQPVVDRDLPR